MDSFELCHPHANEWSTEHITRVQPCAEPGVFFISLPSGSDWRKHSACGGSNSGTNNSANFFKTLHSSGCPLYCVPLPSLLPPPPTELKIYMELVMTMDIEDANSFLFGDEILKPPHRISNYISGSTERCLRFRNVSCAAFVASIFHAIQHASPTSVEFAGWDLYHGHMFLNAQQHGDKLGLDMGILFHAKEFPVEYRASSWSPTFSIGAPEMKGDRDPRIGTKCSLHDQDFSMRNYIWVFSTNKVYLIDTSSAHCPAEIFGNREFSTVDQSFFSRAQLGDVNYFPGLHSESEHLSAGPQSIFLSERVLWGTLSLDKKEDKGVALISKAAEEDTKADVLADAKRLFQEGVAAQRQV
jgi:hypothetical protein